jgi:hypothetical protein
LCEAEVCFVHYLCFQRAFFGYFYDVGYYAHFVSAVLLSSCYRGSLLVYHLLAGFLFKVLILGMVVLYKLNYGGVLYQMISYFRYSKPLSLQARKNTK